MSRGGNKKHDKVPRMTEEQYAEYVMAMKDETPVPGYEALILSARSDVNERRKKRGENTQYKEKAQQT